MGAIASQITSLTIIYSLVYSFADQIKHQSSASLAFVRGFTGDRWCPRTNGQWRGKCFYLMTSSWNLTLAVITPTTILMSYLCFTPLQYTRRSVTYKLHVNLRMTDLKYVAEIRLHASFVAPAIATIRHSSFNKFSTNSHNRGCICNRRTPNCSMKKGNRMN